MTAVQIIQTICKPLADSPSISSYVQMAMESLDSCFFGKMYQHAIAYKACHLFTLCNSASSNTAIDAIKNLSTNEITGITEGELSVSFASSSSGGGTDDLNLTKYGKILLTLMRSRVRMNVNRFI